MDQIEVLAPSGEGYIRPWPGPKRFETHLELDPLRMVQDAVDRALKKADSMLDEISNSEASKARREGRQQVFSTLNIYIYIYIYIYIDRYIDR